MCSVEMMVLNSVMQMQAQEELLEQKREQVEESYARAMGAENLRSTIEESKADWWRDSENRQIIKNRGQDKVISVASGVELGEDGDLLDQKWDASQSEVHGQYTNLIEQNASMGDLRAVELNETRLAQLELFEGPSTLDWVLAIGTAAAQGQFMMEQAGTWDSTDSVFGMDKATWEKWTPWNPGNPFTT